MHNEDEKGGEKRKVLVKLVQEDLPGTLLKAGEVKWRVKL